jgi:hypothetical protein
MARNLTLLESIQLNSRKCKWSSGKKDNIHYVFRWFGIVIISFKLRFQLMNLQQRYTTPEKKYNSAS